MSSSAARSLKRPHNQGSSSPEVQIVQPDGSPMEMKDIDPTGCAAVPETTEDEGREHGVVLKPSSIDELVVSLVLPVLIQWT
jgi:hypothetical protein